MVSLPWNAFDWKLKLFVCFLNSQSSFTKLELEFVIDDMQSHEQKRLSKQSQVCRVNNTSRYVSIDFPERKPVTLYTVPPLIVSGNQHVAR